MKEPLRLTNLHFTDGTIVDVSDSNVIVLVGANNSGKTRVLKEIMEICSTDRRTVQPRTFSLKDVDFTTELTKTELIEWLRHNRFTYISPDMSVATEHEQQFRYKTFIGSQTHENDTRHLPQEWLTEGRLTQVATHLIGGFFAETRLQMPPSGNKPTPGTHPGSPLTRMLEDKKDITEFAEMLKQAFGWNVILDAWSSQLFLRISEDKDQQSFEANTTSGMPPVEIWNEIITLPTIEEQSDGVRSFAGIALNLLASTFPVTLIDEPEAFLHPPQARKLGSAIARLRKEGQVVLATHDSNLLMGLLEDRESKVTVLRLTREDSVVHPQQLTSGDLKKLWSDPLLRFSKALDGMFHDGVVICEGDSDCRFYEAVYDDIQRTARTEDSSVKFPDIAFVQVGGKHKVHKILKALQAVSVPTKVIVDFDILNNTNPLKQILQALEVPKDTITIIEEKRSKLAKQIESGRKELQKKAFLEESNKLLVELGDSDVIPQETKKKIKELITEDPIWQNAKKVGASLVPSGDATNLYNDLRDRLEKLNIFIVPVGTLEMFVSEVGNRSAKWVIEVIEKNLVQNAHLAKEFLSRVLDLGEGK